MKGNKGWMDSRKVRMYKNGFMKGNKGWMDRRKGSMQNWIDGSMGG